MTQAQIRDSDRLVIQTGQGLGERQGHTIVEMTDEAYAGLRAALAEPNGGVRLAVNGSLTVLPAPPEPEPPSNPWADLRLILPYLETQEDTRSVFDIICEINGG